MIDLVLITLVILSPKIEDEFTAITFTPEVLAITADQWIATGVMEVEEKGYRHFRYPANYKRDVETMQSRISEMEVDCPPIRDIKKLPPEDYCRQQWTYSYTYHRYLVKLLDSGLYHPLAKTAIQDNIDNCKSRLEFWDLAVSLYSSWHDSRGRRLTLQKIRQLIGRTAYNNDIWPDPMPDSGYFEPWKLSEEDEYEG